MMVSEKFRIVSIEIRSDHNREHPENPLVSKSPSRGPYSDPLHNFKSFRGNFLGKSIVFCKKIQGIIASALPVGVCFPELKSTYSKWGS